MRSRLMHYAAKSLCMSRLAELKRTAQIMVGAEALCAARRLGKVLPGGQQRILGSGDGPGTSGTGRSQDDVTWALDTAYSRRKSRLQFGRDMCQSSLTRRTELEGTLLGNPGCEFAACASRKIKSKGSRSH